MNENSSSFSHPAKPEPARIAGAVALILALAAGAAQAQQAPGSDSLSEVIVTAQKREERLKDVPIPISVVDGSALAGNSRNLIREYYTTVPGLNVAPNYLARQQLSIRGIMTGGGSDPTTAITIDDVPNGSSKDAAGGSYIPDIDPGDLARIEVLRGPQGTLYGANSLGGLIRYVTVDPSFDRASGRVEAGTNVIHNGDDPGYALRASGNMPVNDSLAVRGSAFTRLDPGYIDNPIANRKGVNEGRAIGGRLAGLWRISDSASLKLSGMYQRVKTDGAPEVQVLPGLGDLQQGFLPDTRGYYRAVQTYNALLNARFGSTELTSLSGYNVNDQVVSDDRSSSFGAPVQKIYGVNGVYYQLHTRTNKFTQELRLAGPLAQSFEWMVGGFYTHEKSPTHTTMTAENTTTFQFVGPFYDYVAPRTFVEYAGFANLTYHVTDRFNIQFGGRESHQELDNMEVTTGLFTQAVLNTPGPVITPHTFTKTNAFTYLVTPQFKVSESFMVYARVASGYRAGNPNSALTVAGGAPATSAPDKTRNYEVGLKADFLDGTLSVDTSLYNIDWDDIQIGLRIPNGVYIANGGTARSRGAEFSITSVPMHGLTIKAWATYTDAELTKAFPATSTAFGASGDRLPFSTRFSGYLSLDSEFPLWGSTLGVVGGSLSYVGDRVGVFQTTAVRQDLPAYTKTDIYGGLRYDSWSANLYVNNLTDKRGLINGGLGYVPTNTFAYIQPRTVGMYVIKTF